MSSNIDVHNFVAGLLKVPFVMTMLRVFVGIHIGPVVAGIISTRNSAYDIWGQTVNIASRLETASEPNKICVSPQYMETLDSEYSFSVAGLKHLRGYRTVKTYFLDCCKDTL